MRPSIFLSSLLATLCSAGPTVIDHSRGITYKGKTSDGVDSFLNIPYAESVSGSRRFTRPVAKHVARGTVINATTSGPDCPQQRIPVPIFPLFSNVTDVAEDCLNLRVDRPSGTYANAKLPVMVYIYGGGDSIGQAYDKLYTPTGLVLGAQAKKIPIIYVAMNYRLNIFGFAASKALAKEGNMNVGLLDQRLALEWVQQNIEAFGGDPKRVTIFGESDGGTSVGLQCTSYGGQGKLPFQQAIMESGSPAADPFVASDFSAKNTESVAQSVGCNSGSSEHVLECLRNVPFHELLNATLKFEKTINSFGFDVFIPSVDGSFVPDAPSKLVRNGQFHKDVSIMIGWNLNEASLFTPTSLKSQQEISKFLAATQPGFTQATIKHLLSLYPASEFHTHDNASREYYRVDRIQRDFEFTCPALEFAFAVQKYSNAKSYVYQLDQTPLVALFKETNNLQYGVPHFSDIFYVFNEVSGLPFPVSSSDYTLASQMSGSWAQFAWTGAPGSDKGYKANATLPAWPQAYEQKDNGSIKSTVFTIGGEHHGPIVITPETEHAGLQQLTKRCEYVASPSFYKKLRT